MGRTDTPADGAIDAVARQRGMTLAEVLETFSLAAYHIDEAFTDAHRADWLAELEVDPLRTDDLGQGRPLRDRYDLVDGGSASGEVTIGPGGIAYVELVPIIAAAGQLEVTVSQSDRGDVEANLYTFEEVALGDGPTLRDTRSMTFADGSATETISVGDPVRRHAVLVLTHAHPIDQYLGPFDETVQWSATYVADTGGTSETFSRVGEGGWGASELGGTWMHGGSPFVWDVDADEGTITRSGPGDPWGAATLDTLGNRLSLPVEILLKQTWDTNVGFTSLWLLGEGATGIQAWMGIFNSFPAYIELGLLDEEGNGDSQDFNLPDPLDDPTGQTFWVRVLIEETQISAKVWLDGTTEPGTFQYVVSDPNLNITEAVMAATTTLEIDANPATGHFAEFDEITFVSGLSEAGGGP